MKWLSVVGCVSLCVLLVAGYPGGAPLEVCQSMTPGHNTTAQNSPFPYSVTLSKSRINSGDSVEVTLSGDAFKGIMLQMRCGNKPVGQFTLDSSNGKQLRLMNCLGGTDNSVTQTGREDKNEVKVSWTSPYNLKDNVYVYVTVVVNVTTFWEDHSTALPVV